MAGKAEFPEYSGGCLYRLTVINRTMNCPEWLMKQVEYPTLLGFTGAELGRLCGYNEVLYSCDTYQFTDYSRYDCNMFPEEKKRAQRDTQFPVDLQNAYDLGKRLAKGVPSTEQ